MTVQEFYPSFLAFPIICIDSRKAMPGSVFIAIKGENFDGNEFAELALNNGCEKAIVDNPKFHDPTKTILVKDSIIFLQDLARHHRKQLNIPVVGLTGTNGKTTTKELIATVLSTKYNVIATEGNLNNHIGVPLTVLRAQKDTEILIVEMGANHEGEIELLSNIALPTHGLITNIGKAHLEGFGSFEGVVRAKNELYHHLVSNERVVFVNQEDKLLLGLLKDYETIQYGNGQGRSPKYEVIPDFMLRFYLNLESVGINERLEINTNLVGNYNLFNALAAITLGNYFGISWKIAAQAISEYSPGMNRSEYRETEKNKLILDAYNANPDSMMEAINFFDSFRESNKVAILGDMRELGEYSAQLHSEIIEELLKKDFDFFLVGEEFSRIAEEYSVKCFFSVEDLIKALEDEPLVGKCILLKGSRGIELEKLVPYL